MANTVKYWVEKFGLAPHPAAKGFFRETFRDEVKVQNINGDERSASTLIYFLHEPEELNDETTFFRVQSTEMIHWYHGEPMTIYYMPNKDSSKMEKVVLGPTGDHFHICLPRDRWFTRLCITDKEGGFTLVGATVAPGFDFKDLETKTYAELK